ncbi:hypothetical protein [Deinococcus sp.]|uniref:hypothetical protein n=1 Tax=Deinococcus sp. TaxID=47478 RepID=UPI0025BF6B42|nr:hypothetical protein [Deinococcus sp.]
MTLSPDLPQRAATPEERRRAGRMFWLILLLFPMVVGTMLAYLSVRGRQVRDYGQAVVQEVATRATPLQGRVPCHEVASAKAPASVKSCEAERLSGGKVTVTIQTSGGQKYQLHNAR